MPVSKAAQREATVRKLVDLGRSMFAQYGYAETSMEELVAQAGVTRGALYHHFGSKDGLFTAVLADVQRGIADRIEQASARQPDSWGQLVAGCREFLEASVDPQVQRIVLIDAPSVLGWEAWRQADAQNAMRQLRDMLQILRDEGIIANLSLDAMVHLVSGAMNEGALWIARSEQPTEALASAFSVLERVLTALRR